MSEPQPIDAGPFRTAAVDLSGPTRSIQIARALIERFAEITRVTGSGMLLGGADMDRMELVIGEASQIYPEIWANLDAAYGALTKRDMDVPGYEAARHGGPMTGGVLESAVVGSGRYQQKTATFDVAGHRRANQAAQALQRAMPTVDWAALDQADAEMMAGANLGPSLGTKVVFYVIAGILAALVIAGFVAYKLEVWGALD